MNYYLLNDLSIGVMDDVEDIVDSDAFRQSRLFPAWESFLALAMKRLEVFESVDLREYSTFKACDNMQVSRGSFHTEHSFHRQTVRHD